MNFHWKENVKIQKSSDFGGFQSPQVKQKKKVKNHQIPMFDCQCVAKIIKGWLNIFTSYLVYS